MLPPALPPAEVEAVVVHAPRLPAMAGEGAFSVIEIGSEELRQTPRLDAALKRAPGVSLFRRTGSDAANPTIQGLSLRAIAPSGAGRALVTLDGAPQNDPFGGWVIWSSLPPEGLDGATIIRGAGAGAYGAGALTGVVALRERGLSSGLSALDLSIGERGFYRAAGAVGTEHLLLTASAETTDGYTPVNKAVRGAADRPTAFDAYSVGLRIQGDLGPVAAALRLSAYDEERGAGLLNANSNASGTSAALTLAQVADDGDGWRVQGWVRSSDLANSSAAVAAGRVTTTPANDQYETPAIGYGLNAAWRHNAGPWAWEVGADARFTDGETRELFRYMAGNYTRNRVAGGKTAVGGVYVEGVVDRGELVLTGGARVDAWEQTDAVRRERDVASGALVLDQKADGASGVTPTARLGFRWGASDGVYLRGAAYAGFRPPTLNELHRPFRVGNDITEANPGLEPETLSGIEFGVGGYGELAWALTAFATRLKDPITNVTIGVGPGSFPVAGFVPAGGVLRQRQNAGAIEAIGVDAEFAQDVGPLALSAALQVTEAEVDGGSAAPQLTGKRPAQTPQVTVTAGLDWAIAERLRLAADLRFESERFEDDLNTRRLAPAAGLDLRLGWRVRSDTELYLAAENVADAELEVGETGDGVESYATPRTVRIGLSIRR